MTRPPAEEARAAYRRSLWGREPAEPQPAAPPTTPTSDFDPRLAWTWPPINTAASPARTRTTVLQAIADAEVNGYSYVRLPTVEPPAGGIRIRRRNRARKRARR